MDIHKHKPVSSKAAAVPPERFDDLPPIDQENYKDVFSLMRDVYDSFTRILVALYTVATGRRGQRIWKRP